MRFVFYDLYYLYIHNNYYFSVLFYQPLLAWPEEKADANEAMSSETDSQAEDNDNAKSDDYIMPDSASRYLELADFMESHIL